MARDTSVYILTFVYVILYVSYILFVVFHNSLYRFAINMEVEVEVG